MTLVEKIALEIAFVGGTMGGHDWEDWTPEAIAALRAMRDPTESMLRAGLGHHYRLDTKLGASSALSDWQAMIDQAIKEGE